MENKHNELFLDYAVELESAKDAAESWWKNLLAAEASKRGDRNEATILVGQRWPLGPAAHPRVIAVLRKYWLACDALNHEIMVSGHDSEDEHVIPPPVFLCEFLLDGKHERLAGFISPLNYWPIGREDDERDDS